MNQYAFWNRILEENDARISEIIAEQGKLIEQFIINGYKSLAVKFRSLAEEFQRIHKDHHAGIKDQI